MFKNILAVFLCMFAACTVNHNYKPRIIKVGNNGQLFLSSIKQPAILHFWSSWCRACTQELKSFNSYSRIARSRGISVFTIAVNDSSDKIFGKIPKNDLGFEVAIDDKGKLKQMFDIDGVPQTVFLPSAILGKQYKVSGAQDWFNEDNMRKLDAIAFQPQHQ